MKTLLTGLFVFAGTLLAPAQEKKQAPVSADPPLRIGRVEGRAIVMVQTTGTMEDAILWRRLKALKPAPLDLSLATGTVAISWWGLHCDSKLAINFEGIQGVFKAIGFKTMSLDALGAVSKEKDALVFTVQGSGQRFRLLNRPKAKGEKSEPPDLSGEIGKKVEDGTSTFWIAGEVKTGGDLPVIHLAGHAVKD